MRKTTTGFFFSLSFLFSKSHEEAIGNWIDEKIGQDFVYTVVSLEHDVESKATFEDEESHRNARLRHRYLRDALPRYLKACGVDVLAAILWVFAWFQHAPAWSKTAAGDAIAGVRSA